MGIVAENLLTVESLKTSSIVSVIFGCLIIIAGAILIFKKKRWAWGVVSLGIISVVSNGIKLYRIFSGTYETPAFVRWVNKGTFNNLDSNAGGLVSRIESSIEISIENILTPEIMMLGNIAGIVIGLILSVVGVILRKKGWAWILILLGVTSMLTSIMQMIWW